MKNLKTHGDAGFQRKDLSAVGVTAAAVWSLAIFTTAILTVDFSNSPTSFVNLLIEVTCPKEAFQRNP